MLCQRRDQQEAFFGIYPQKAEPQHRSQLLFIINVHHEPDSLSIVMVVSKYPLTSLKAVLFSHSLSAEVTGIVQAIHSKWLMLGKMSLNPKMEKTF